MYSMYVLLADKVSCPMTQHYGSGDSQISKHILSMLFKVCVWFVCFNLLSYLHDKKESDTYFVISRESNMLATLKK